MARKPETVLGRVASRSRAKIRSLTASAERADGTNSQQMQRLFQPWQAQALAMYDQVPEIKFAATVVARPLEKLRLYVAVLDEKGQPGEEASEEAQAILNRVQDPGGGRAVMMSSYGRLMFLNGEGRLICTPSNDDTDPDGEKWEFVSVLELRVNPGDPPTYTRIKAPQLGQETLRDAGDDLFSEMDDSARVYRFWRRHPAYSQLADSSMQAVIGECELLMLLTATVRSHAISRIAGSGILLVPEEVSPAPPMPIGDEDPAEDPFLDEFTQSMVAPIADPTDASAAVPLVVRGQAEYLKEFRHLSIHDPAAVYPETSLRTECIDRIATGIDVPADILKNIADANHWNAWQIAEQTWVTHQEPLAQMFCDDLTSSYYRAAAKEAGLENWEDLVVTFDPASITNHPDRANDAKDLHDRLVISDATLREANGFTDDDAPDEAELKRRQPPAPGPPEVGEEEELTPEEQALVDGSTTEKAPPDEDEAREEQTEGAIKEKVKAMTAAAAEMGIVRGRELAGARLRNKIQGDPKLKKLIDGAPQHMVASVLGPSNVAVDCEGLVAGAASFTALSLKRMGIEGADELALEVEAYAARTLFEAEPTPFAA